MILERVLHFVEERSPCTWSTPIGYFFLYIYKRSMLQQLNPMPGKWQFRETYSTLLLQPPRANWQMVGPCHVVFAPRACPFWPLRSCTIRKNYLRRSHHSRTIHLRHPKTANAIFLGLQSVSNSPCLLYILSRRRSIWYLNNFKDMCFIFYVVCHFAD